MSFFTAFPSENVFRKKGVQTGFLEMIPRSLVGDGRVSQRRDRAYKNVLTGRCLFSATKGHSPEDPLRDHVKSATAVFP